MLVWLRASPARGQSWSWAKTGPMPALQSSPLSCGTSESASSILLAQDQTHLGHFEVITIKFILSSCRAEIKSKLDPGWVRSRFSLSPPQYFWLLPSIRAGWVWPCLHAGLHSWQIFKMSFREVFSYCSPLSGYCRHSSLHKQRHSENRTVWIIEIKILSLLSFFTSFYSNHNNCK